MRSRMLAVIWAGLLLYWAVWAAAAGCVPAGGCPALADYVVQQGDNLQGIGTRFSTNATEIARYNSITNIDFVVTGKGLRVPFSCVCVQDVLQGIFEFIVTNEYLSTIASDNYSSLTTVAWIASASNVSNVNSVFPGQRLTVPVNCSCGSPDLRQYGLFTTYVVRTGDTASSIAANFTVPVADLLASNPGVDFGGLQADVTILFVPTRDLSGQFPAFSGGTKGHGLNIGAVVGGAVGGVIVVAGLCSVIAYFVWRRPRQLVPAKSKEQLAPPGFRASTDPSVSGSSERPLTSGSLSRTTFSGSYPAADFIVDKSVEYSYEELAAATSNFSIANKVGQGGYGAVYYGELRGQKVAVKRMNLQATKEFLAELQVLTHVHHTNLLQLLGFCTVESLFLVYEFVENGTLDEHLHRASRRGTSLTWVQRIQIALDAARGLEYIHEHTKPTYIHRDVKSANILIDKQFHAKVADFGLTKLTEPVGAASTVQTKVAGTFGYLSPEYARYGDVSAKVDVYSFGVVLYEILSGKEAIVRIYAEAADAGGAQREEQKGLVTLFEAVLRAPDARERLRTLTDASLGNNYPADSAYKLAQLAQACTQENPELRPNMRAVVVALMTLSSSTQEWELGTFAGDHMGSLISGR